jgi:hypothetical protein
MSQGWLIGIAVIIGLFLALWLVNSLYAIYVQIAFTSPWLANIVISAILIAIAIAVGIVLYYLWSWKKPRKSKTKKPPSKIKLPESKTAIVNESILAVNRQIDEIQDEVNRQVLIEQSQEIAQELAKGELKIVVFGTGSAGKTSLINALLGRVVGEVGAPMGTTKLGSSYNLPIKGVKRPVIVIDTPGILEAGIAGTEREKLARELAIAGNLLLFVVDNDLRQSEYIPLKTLAEIGKRSILILNKSDLYTTEEQELIIKKLQERVRDIISPQDIVAIMANPQPITLDNGEIWTPEPEIMPLIKRISSVLKSEGENLIADNILIQSQRLSDQAKELLNQQRKAQSNQIISRFQWISAGVVTVNPLPVVDFLATAAVNTQMIVEIGKIYGCELNSDRAKELAVSLGKTIGTLGLVKGAIAFLSTALQTNIATYLVGKTIQGVTTAYLTHIAGKSFIEYFQRDQDWGDGGINEVVKRQFELNKREEFIKVFIQEAVEKVRMEN